MNKKPKVAVIGVGGTMSSLSAFGPLDVVDYSAKPTRLEADEPHPTFIENALAKARHAARACGGAAMADDSGLCVDALGGDDGFVTATATSGIGAAPTFPNVGPRAASSYVIRDAAQFAVRVTPDDTPATLYSADAPAGAPAPSGRASNWAAR